MTSVYACIFELPDGEHLIATGPTTEARAKNNLRAWFDRNPDAKWNVEKVIPVTRPELTELRESIAARYPRRRPLKDIFKGVPMLAFDQPHRIPGSRLKPDVVIPGGAWGSLGKW